MTEEEHALAVERIPVVEKEGITWKTFRYTLSRPMWWICVPTYIFMQLTSYWTTYMALWLKSARYPVEMVNVLPTFIDLIRAFSSWLGTTLAGTLSLRGLWTFQFVRSHTCSASLFCVLLRLTSILWVFGTGGHVFRVSDARNMEYSQRGQVCGLLPGRFFGHGFAHSGLSSLFSQP